MSIVLDFNRSENIYLGYRAVFLCAVQGFSGINLIKPLQPLTSSYYCERMLKLSADARNAGNLQTSTSQITQSFKVEATAKRLPGRDSVLRVLIAFSFRGNSMPRFSHDPRSTPFRNSLCTTSVPVTALDNSQLDSFCQAFEGTNWLKK